MKNSADIIDFVQQRIALIEECVAEGYKTPGDDATLAALRSVLDFAQGV